METGNKERYKRQMNMKGEGTGRIRSIIKIISIKFLLASLQEEELFYWGREVTREGQL